MDREPNHQLEQMTAEEASHPHSNWPAVHAGLDSQAREQQLQATYERFQALATASGQIYWTTRPDGRTGDSPFWCAYTGQAYDEAQGLGWLEAIHPEDRECVYASWRRAIAAKDFFETEYRIRRADGVYHPFLVRGLPVFDEYGDIREWVGICTDISERKQMEETLQASEAHFRTTFEHAPVGIGNATLEGYWFDVNQPLCDMLGYTREELLTRTFQEVTHPDDLEASLDYYNRLLAGSCQSYTLEKRYLRKDGSLIWINLTVSLVRTPEGKPHHTIGIIEDISQRKQLEEAFQASEAHFRATFDRAPVGIGQTNQQGKWLSVNQHLCDMLGYTREELLTRTFQDITHPDDLEESLKLSKRLWSGESPSLAMEKRYLRKDGSPIWVNVTISLVRTPEGKFHHTVVIIEDISRRKQIEEERAQLLEREQQARAQAEATAQRLRAIQMLTDTALEHLSLEDLLRELLDRICEVMAVDAATSLLLSEDGQFLTVYAGRGLDGEVGARLRVPVGTGVSGKIAASQKPLIVDDLSRVELADPYLQKNLCSLVGVPLLVKSRVIGVILAGTTQLHHFTQDDVQVLEMVAYRIALAVDHAHLFQAEQQARSEAAARARQLEATIEAMTEGVGIYDPQGFELLTNRSGRKILGIEDPDRFRAFTSRPHAERIAMIHCRDRDGNPYPPARSPLTRALKGEVVPDAQSEDMIITALDGYERHLSGTASPIRDAAGQLTGAVFVYRDVTERRLLERKTHDALGALLEMAEALVAPEPAEKRLFGEDTQSRIGIVAQRLAELTARVLGYERVGIAAVDPETTQIIPLAVVTPSAAEEQQWWDRRLYAPRLNESSDPALSERLCAGEVLVLDTGSPPYSEPHPFNLPTILIAPMCVGKQLIGLLSVGHEGAGHEFSPQALALAGAVAKLTALVIEREHLLRQREEARANELAIREANRRMEAFLGIASHELKTPLTTIQLHLQLAQRRLQRLAAQEEALAPGVAQEVARLREQLLETQDQWARLDRLVNDLLDVSRIQAGTLHLSLSPLDLGTLVQGVIEEQRQVHPGRQIEWSRSCAKPLPVLADAGRISQVVLNYLSNALKYAPEAAPIEVGIAREAAQARVWVRDQGPGLTPEQQSHLWERFHRVPGVEVQSGSGVGMGLGLHICKTIIEQHQGQVGVESVPGQGSTFWFTLPLAEESFL
jgi:PAS domain S-box-containing protein